MTPQRATHPAVDLDAVRETARIWDNFLDGISSAARAVARKPEDHPKPPDLIAEVEQCATELDEAAKIIEHGYPQVAQLFTLAARRARANAAKARETGHV